MLRNELKKQGDWLFQRRGLVPLVFLPVVAIALRDADSLQQHVGPSGDLAWKIACAAISFIGVAIRCLTVGFVPKGTSGRNTVRQVADELNTTGIYSTVRNPIYFGNFLMGLGVALSVGVLWLPVIYMLAFWLYYERIIFAEEVFLEEKFGDRYREWASQTPVFIPKLGKWKPPALPFSTRRMIGREYGSPFFIVALFALLSIAGRGVSKGQWEFGRGWQIALGVSVLAWLTLLTLKISTKVLTPRDG